MSPNSSVCASCQPDTGGGACGRPCAVGIVDRTVPVHEESLALKADSERVRTLIELAPGPIAVVSGPDLVFDLLNKALCRFAGRRDLIGQRLTSVLPELECQGAGRHLREISADGTARVIRDLSVRLHREPGGPLVEFVHDVLYQPLRDAAGKVSSVFWQIADVTERHTAERALRESDERALAPTPGRCASLYRRRAPATAR